MINSVFNKKPITTTIFNSQVGAVIFICAFAHKASSLPAIISQSIGSSTLWLYVFMSVVDLVCFVLNYYFFSSGTDEALEGSNAYKIGVAFLLTFLALKGVVFFAHSAMYLSLELFVNVSPFVVISILLVPIVYIGTKGIKTIARTCEILFPVVFFIIVANLVFIKSQTDFARNLPVFAVEPSEFFKTSMQFGLWLCDPLPLIFVRVKNKKRPYVSLSAGCCFLLLNVCVLVGMAIYGDSMRLVSNLLVKMAGFNLLSLEIGRLEWTVLFAVMTMGLATQALTFWGINECAIRLFKTDLPTKICWPVLLLCLGLFLPSLQTIIDFSHGRIVGTVAFAVALSLSAYFALLKYRYEKKRYDFPFVYERIPKSAEVQNE